MKLLKFKASWCGPCKVLAQTMDKISFPYEVETIDIEEDMPIAQKYGVRGVPMLVLIDDNEEVIATGTGTMSESTIREKFIL